MLNKIIVRLILLVCIALSLSACETIKGAGQDIENAGEELEDAVE